MKHTMTFVVASAGGLHARPASELVRAAVAFEAEIVLCRHGKFANAKSLLAILLLGAAQGTELVATAVGSDATAALFALGRTSCLAGGAFESDTMHA